MFYSSENEIDALAAAFANHSLDKAAWTHEAHLTMAVYHLKKFDLYEATCLLRSGIISYNLSLGNRNTGSQGYHESITIGWIAVVDFFVKENADSTMLDTCNAFLASPLADKNLLFHFYEKDHLLSSAARAGFAAPTKHAISAENLRKILQGETVLQDSKM